MHADPAGRPLAGPYAVQTDHEVIAGEVHRSHEGHDPSHNVQLDFLAERVSSTGPPRAGSDSGLDEGPGKGKCGRVHLAPFLANDPLRDRVRRVARAAKAATWFLRVQGEFARREYGSTLNGDPD